MTPKHPPVFVYAYHKVLPKKSFDIGLKLFEFHLKVFKKFFHTLSWEEFKAYLEGDFVPKKRAMFITFDDGYADNFVYAYPLLKKYNLKAHLFLIPSRIREKPIKRKTLLDYWEGKASLDELHKPKTMWDANREFFTKGESEDFLTWEEVNAMKDVFTFGSHSMSHAQGFVSCKAVGVVNDRNINRIYSLWKIYSPPKAGYPIFEMKSDLTAPIGEVDPAFLRECERLYKEGKSEKEISRFAEESCPLRFETEEQYTARVLKDLRTSKELIEKFTGEVVDSFSYPWGDYSERLLPLVERYYNYAFTVQKRKVQTGENKLLIPRVYAVKDVFTFLGHLWRFAR
jgi:peptidoglycan/xylan/chitin deacetylase (PgdA/CDA1 family)